MYGIRRNIYLVLLAVNYWNQGLNYCIALLLTNKWTSRWAAGVAQAKGQIQVAGGGSKVFWAPGFMEIKIKFVPKEEQHYLQ